MAGEDTGRVPTLEGDPISLGKARLLACEGLVIPNVFNYRTGEALELGRALRLPNSALRRKLELEQPGGCAWNGCLAPVQWTEAHHIRHWSKVTNLRPAFALAIAYHLPENAIFVDLHYLCANFEVSVHRGRRLGHAAVGVTAKDSGSANQSIGRQPAASIRVQ
ncbi:hypothetical protein [Glycomyces tarimensis]